MVTVLCMTWSSDLFVDVSLNLTRLLFWPSTYVHSKIVELVHVLVYEMDLESNQGYIFVQVCRNIIHPTDRRSIQLLDNGFAEVNIAGWPCDARIRQKRDPRKHLMGVHGDDESERAAGRQ